MSVQEEIETILSSAEPTVEVLRVDPIDVDRHVRPAAPRQSAGGRALFDRQELTQLMPAEVAELLHVGM